MSISSAVTALATRIATEIKAVRTEFVRKGTLLFNVKDYGALGDGTTDDRVAIQATVTAAAAVKGIVFFPPGTYLVSLLSGSTPKRAITVAAGVTFRGAGAWCSIIKLAGGVGEYTTIFGHVSGTESGGVSFEDLTIDQNNTNNQAVTELVALGLFRYVIYITNATSPTRVERCNFVDMDNVNSVAVTGAVHNLIVRGCSFAIGSAPISHDHSTIYHHALVSRAVWVEDNTFTSPGSGANGAVTAIETHGSAQYIRGNEVRNFRIGANLTGVGHSTTEGIVCEGNSFLDVAYGIQPWSMPYTGGVTANPTLRAMIIRNNMIRIDAQGWEPTFTSGQSMGGIKLGTATGSIEDVIIEDNYIVFVIGSHVGSSTTDNNANGIDWYRSSLDSAVVDRRVSIRRNTVVNAVASGIRVSCYGEAFDVSDNLVLNAGRGSVAAGGAVINGYAVGVSVTGVLTHSKVNRNCILDTQSTHTTDIAIWLYPLATGSANNECMDNHASGFVTKLLQTHATNGGWKFRATILGTFASPGGLLAVDSQIIERSTGGVYRQVTAPEGSTWQLGTYSPTAHASTHASAGSDPVTPAAIGAQPVDADLTTIAGLTATTDNIIQSVGSAWASRTPAQVKTALALSNVDNTSDVNKPISTASKSYIQSRAENLITNGSGGQANNTNFTSFTFDAADTHGGGGSFKKSGASQTVFTDENIPVDSSKYLRMVVWGKAGDIGGGNYDATNRQFIGIQCLDIDQLSISPQFFLKNPGSTDTTLAAQLNPNDTTVTLTDATGWHNGSTGFSRNFLWWPYVNSKGYTYDNYTYSRNASSNYHADWATNGSWAASGISGNVITLRQPWAGPTLAAGTPVRNHTSGSTYKYIAASNVILPNSWTRYEGYVGTVDTTSINDTNKFSPGTAFVRLVFVLNTVGASTTTVRVSDLWLSEESARNLELATTTTPGVVTYGTTSGTAAQGNDSRIVGAVQTTRTVTGTGALTGGGDLSANRTLDVAAGGIGSTQIAAAIKDPAAATAGLRTLGTGAAQAAPGDDVRFSLAVTTAGRPAAGSVAVGTPRYDTTINKPIWSDGTNWRDATGTVV